MKIDNLSDLPDWDDDEFNENDEREGWKPKATKEACKTLYRQWQQIVTMLNGAMETMEIPESSEEEISFPKEYWDDYVAMIKGDAYQVGAKLKSSEADLYTIRMENASIIRKNAQHIYSALLTMAIEKVIEETYVMAIRREIEVFRELFKHWVCTFEKDEYKDEWGLFI